jgi:hypothetical protein
MMGLLLASRAAKCQYRSGLLIIHLLWVGVNINPRYDIACSRPHKVRVSRVVADMLGEAFYESVAFP